MKAIDILKGAKEVLKNPASWTQGTCARDADGTNVEVYSDEAVCFCIYGAAVKTAGWKACGVIVEAIKPFLEDMTVGAWNDVEGRTHAEVIAKFDEIINELEKQNV